MHFLHSKRRTYSKLDQLTSYNSSDGIKRKKKELGVGLSDFGLSVFERRRSLDGAWTYWSTVDFPEKHFLQQSPTERWHVRKWVRNVGNVCGLKAGRITYDCLRGAVRKSFLCGAITFGLYVCRILGLRLLLTLIGEHRCTDFNEKRMKVSSSNSGWFHERISYFISSNATNKRQYILSQSHFILIEVKTSLFANRQREHRYNHYYKSMYRS